MKRLKLFIINTFILVITSFFVRGICIIFDIYIANKIGSEGIGLFNLVMSIYFFAITIASSGINLASTRIVAEDLANNNVFGAKIAIKKCINYSIIFGLISCIILILIAPFIVHNLLHNKIQKSCIYIIALSLPFSSIATAINGYFIGVKRISNNSSYEIFNTLLKILLTYFLFKLFNIEKIETACYILLLSNAITEFLSFIYLYFLYKLDIKKLPDLRHNTNNYFKRILKISIPVAITSYIRSGLSTVKQLLIPLSLQKNGLTYENSISSYGMISGMIMPLLLFPGLIINSISSLLIPEFARYNTKKDFNRMHDVINVFLTLCLIFSILIAGIYICFNKPLSEFTYHNLEIANYLLLLAPLSIFMYLDHLTDAILKGIDKQLGVMYCNIIDLFMSILLISALLPIYGLYGYIAILYISEIFNFTISYFQLKKSTNYTYNMDKSISLIFKFLKQKP